MNFLVLWCYRRRRIVVLLWLLVLAGLFAISQQVGARYSEDFVLPDTESKRAIDLLAAAAPEAATEEDGIVVKARTGTLDDPAVKGEVQRMLSAVGPIAGLTRVGDVYGFEGRISPDRTVGLAPVRLRVPANNVTPDDVDRVVEGIKRFESPTLQLELSGPSANYAAERPTEGPNEALGIAAAAVVLFIAFGSAYTMFLPIATALLALGTGISVITFLTHTFTITDLGPTLAALIGLGVGVDYALFIVSRHRINLMKGMGVEESVSNAMNTSGRAVLFAGTTVCIGLAGLFLLGISFLYGMAISAIVAVVLTMIASVTFLPAMLGFVGARALSSKQRRAVADGHYTSNEEMSAGWLRFARYVQRRPIPLAALAFAFMAILAIPFFDIRLGDTDAGGDPVGSTTRNSYDLLAEGFGAGFNGPLTIVAELDRPEDVASVASLVAGLQGHQNVAAVTPVQPLPGGRVAVAQVIPKSSPQDEATTELIDDIRENVTRPFAERTGTDVMIAGSVAVFHDFTQVLVAKTPLFVTAIVGLSFLLLMAMFRSVLVPAKASLMNLLSAAASFGVVVAIFQWGVGAELFGVDRTGPITPFLPVIAFAILFGLSMDYEVFLVSRMYEEWLRRGDNEEAIALGQAETGRVITAAASIMIVIFMSFVFGGDPVIKLFGIALATAVLLDALVIRTLLVPALMQLFGGANWYLPKWLDRLLPQVNIEPKGLEKR